MEAFQQRKLWQVRMSKGGVPGQSFFTGDQQVKQYWDNNQQDFKTFCVACCTAEGIDCDDVEVIELQQYRMKPLDSCINGLAFQKKILSARQSEIDAAIAAKQAQ